MNRQSKIIVIILLLVFTVINLIGFNRIPAAYIVITAILSIIITVWGLVSSKYFKRNNIFLSLFFIFILISVAIVALDMIFKGYWSQYTKEISDILYVFITFFLFTGVFLGLIGVIKKSKK